MTQEIKDAHKLLKQSLQLIEAYKQLAKAYRVEGKLSEATLNKLDRSNDIVKAIKSFVSGKVE